jgi:hypothetical protein
MSILLVVGPTQDLAVALASILPPIVPELLLLRLLIP